MPLVRPPGPPSWIRFYSRRGDQRLKTTSLPRLIANAALLAALAALAVSLRAQAPTQSYLRNTPSEIEREDPRVQSIIARADEHFKLGELNLRNNKRPVAREELDQDVD